jgi:hypothetical protein
MRKGGAEVSLLTFSSDDLRALAKLVDDGDVQVIRHQGLLAVLRPDEPRRKPPTHRTGSGR